MEDKNMEVFKSAPVPQAVLRNVLPAMAAMLMVLIYNLADTFFIGQTRNDILIAAVSLAMKPDTIYSVAVFDDTAKTFIAAEKMIISCPGAVLRLPSPVPLAKSLLRPGKFVI